MAPEVASAPKETLLINQSDTFIALPPFLPSASRFSKSFPHLPYPNILIRSQLRRSFRLFSHLTHSPSFNNNYFTFNNIHTQLPNLRSLHTSTKILATIPNIFISCDKNGIINHCNAYNSPSFAMFKPLSNTLSITH